MGTMILNSDTEVKEDCIFKKHLNAGFPRPFIYSVINAFDGISTH